MASTAEELAAAHERVQIQLENQRQLLAQQQNHSLQMTKTTAYSQYVSIAYQALAENKRALPVDQRTITPEEVIAFADVLKAGSESATGT